MIRSQKSLDQLFLLGHAELSREARKSLSIVRVIRWIDKRKYILLAMHPADNVKDVNLVEQFTDEGSR